MSEECARTTYEKATTLPVEISTKSPSQLIRQTEVSGGTNFSFGNAYTTMQKI